MVDTQGIVFVEPEGSDRVSGGNLYNRQLIEALSAWPEFRTLGVKEFCQEKQGAHTYIVDTLSFREFSQVLCGRVPGQRFILLVHHLPSLEPDIEVTSSELFMERSLITEFDGFITTSNYTAELLTHAGHGKRVFVGEPPMPQNLSPERDYTGPPRALMASNLIPRKGVLEFLQAFAALVSKELPYRLYIAGRSDMDEKYSDSCHQVLARHEHLTGKVQFLGALAYNEMRSRFEEANLYVSSSRMETFGIALQEARHYGLPIFAVDGGNTKAHICPGQTGELVATPQELGLELAALFSQPKRLQVYYRHAQRRRPAASETWPQLATRLLETLSRW